MVTEQVEAPEPQETPTYDLTPEGQDVPDTGPEGPSAVETSSTPEEPTQQQAPQDIPAQQPPAEGAPAEETSPQSFTELRDQVRGQQEQLQYYSQLEQRAQMQQMADQYSQQLQQQGYLPEQAQQAAQSRMAQAEQYQQVNQQADQYRLFREGQRNAAVHFVKQFGLGVDEVSMLEKYNTPAEMEFEAKRLSETRSLRAENAKLKQQEVPAQSFDNNQPSPSATGSENDLLDKYIGGDRSPNVVAAAARLLG